MTSKTIQEPTLRADGMETLSALFDGELEGDAARFATKRLGHDLVWQQAFDNWQLSRDAMRGQAGSVAPSGFAARVAQSVLAEASRVDPVPTDSAAVGATAAASPVVRRNWMGGAALAATVAMVAIFISRPQTPESSLSPAIATTVPIEFSPNTAPVPAQALVEPGREVAVLPESALQDGAAGKAVADVPRRSGVRRSREQGQRVALRVARRPTAAPASASTAIASNALAMDEAVAPSKSSPFRPQHVESAARPWPRAVLPASPATGAFTASFDAGNGSSRSFYPFDPRLSPLDASAVPVNVEDRNR